VARHRGDDLPAAPNGGYLSVQEDAARLAIGTMMKARAG
jgi:hypothetical protein